MLEKWQLFVDDNLEVCDEDVKAPRVIARSLAWHKQMVLSSQYFADHDEEARVLEEVYFIGLESCLPLSDGSDRSASATSVPPIPPLSTTVSLEQLTQEFAKLNEEIPCAPKVKPSVKPQATSKSTNKGY